MQNYRKHIRNASWLVFLISMIVYWFSVERVGSLWDVGEFILGAYKLQVVHPPGAPLFLIIGRMFAWVAELLSDDPSTIAFAVNMMSAVCTAFAAFFIAQITGILGKLALVGRDRDTTSGEGIAVGMAALVAGLATAFSTSNWFSAVEGEVYAMSTLFTAATVWVMIKWYDMHDTAKADRWLILAVFVTGLSVGVHLLSLLTFPALAMFYFYKKYPNSTGIATKFGSVIAFIIAALSAIVAFTSLSVGSVFNLVFFGLSTVGFAYLGLQGLKPEATRSVRLCAGSLTAAMAGMIVLVFAQAVVIKGIPALWAKLEVFMVNTLGLPFHSGLIPLTLLFAGLIYFGLNYAKKNKSRVAELITMSVLMLVVGFSVVGVVVIRANANTPINMNAPTDAMRLQYYLNREQYGDRPLLSGPQFDVDRNNISYERTDVLGRVGDRYEVVNEKVSYAYRSQDKVLFPRMGDSNQGRPRIYRDYWMGGKKGRPSMSDNLQFFVRYQLGWMYWRYFMWNFSGRQNHDQGYFDTDPTSGNWITGIDFIDEMILGVDLSELPEEDRNDEGRNEYYAIPFIAGLIGAFFHFRKRPEDFLGVLTLFVIMGIGIIIYTNQPPNEPRERDYVQAGAIFTYCIWVGMGVLGIFSLLRKRAGMEGIAPAAIAGALVLVAPALMAFEGFDDHSRMEHEASRDYAANFLNSLAPNAIIFTYGDNDTYPLWYAQEVEGIRTDVRVVNLSLIAVDWYINLLRRKVNDSERIKLTLPEDKIRGNLRNQVPVMAETRPLPIDRVLQFIAEDHPQQLSSGASLATVVPTQNIFIPVTPEAALQSGVVDDLDSLGGISRVNINLAGRNWLMKDNLAVLDIIGSNVWERPVYFAITVPADKMMGMDDYMRLEGLALRLTPYKQPSDQRFSTAGSGRVDHDKVFTNLTEVFEYGNFDTKDLFVDPSYAASVQSMQTVFIRGMESMRAAGDMDRAGELASRYFAAFPAMNFPYNYMSMRPIETLIVTGRKEEAKEHIRILAKTVAERLNYLSMQSSEVAGEGTFMNRDYRSNAATLQQIQALLQTINDPAFTNEINSVIQPVTVGPS